MTGILKRILNFLEPKPVSCPECKKEFYSGWSTQMQWEDCCSDECWFRSEEKRKG